MNEPFVRKIYESGSDSVGSGIQDVIPENGADLEDDILQHVTTFVIPFPGGKK